MFWGWLVVLRELRDGGIAGVAEVVDGSAHFEYSFLWGKLFGGTVPPNNLLFGGIRPAQ